jgi:hypothetical protein
MFYKKDNNENSFTDRGEINGQFHIGMKNYFLRNVQDVVFFLGGGGGLFLATSLFLPGGRGDITYRFFFEKL